ncbi:hypothetical protein Trydic_g19766 [Trypoxylus dichotomus]
MVHINPFNAIHLLLLSYNCNGKLITQINAYDLIYSNLRQTWFVVEIIEGLEYKVTNHSYAAKTVVARESSSFYDLEDVDEEYLETCALEMVQIMTGRSTGLL